MKNKLCLGLLAVASGAYLVRRLGLRWGATDAEVSRPLPGDEVVPLTTSSPYPIDCIRSR